MKEIYGKIDEILINEERPSFELNKMLADEELDMEPFKVLSKLKDIPQELKYHPEGNVWNHVMLVIDRGASYKKYSKDQRRFMWSLLLHDIGKISTTKLRKGRITSYDHDKVGKEMVLEFFSYFQEEESFVKEVASLVRWHMQALFVTNSLPFADINSMIKEVDLKDITLISICDRLGRGRLDDEKVNKTYEVIQNFVDIVSSKGNLKGFNIYEEFNINTFM